MLKKKIISISICLLLIVSMFLMPVSAEGNLYYKNLTPTAMFFYLEDYNGKVFRFIDESPNKVFDGNDYLYLTQLLLDEQQIIKGQNIFYVVNLKENGFTFKQGIKYSLKFKVIVPTRYADGSTGFTFDVSGFSAGLFTWKSVTYPDRRNYFQALISPQIEKWFNNEPFEWEPYPYEYVPISGNTHTFSYIDIEADFIPSKDTTCLSIGINLPFGNINRWNDYIGIGGLVVGASEEAYAEDSGNDSINQALDIIPNDSQKFVNAIGNLANSVSYSGTEAVLTIPKISLPAFAGLTKEYTLIQETKFDFKPYIDMLPVAILTLLRVLLTLALIIFCFKELYSIIQMVMVNKGGGE